MVTGGRGTAGEGGKEFFLSRGKGERREKPSGAEESVAGAN